MQCNVNVYTNVVPIPVAYLLHIVDQNGIDQDIFLFHLLVALEIAIKILGDTLIYSFKYYYLTLKSDD